MKQESFSAADCMQQCGSPSAWGIFLLIEIGSYYTATAISANSLQTLTTLLLHSNNYVIGILNSETALDAVVFESGGCVRMVKISCSGLSFLSQGTRSCRVKFTTWEFNAHSAILAAIKTHSVLFALPAGTEKIFMVGIKSKHNAKKTNKHVWNKKCEHL